MTQPPERSIPAIELDRWLPALEAASSQLRRIARDRLVSTSHLEGAPVDPVSTRTATNEEVDRMNRHVADTFWLQYGREPAYDDPADQVLLEQICTWQAQGCPLPVGATYEMRDPGLRLLP